MFLNKLVLMKSFSPEVLHSSTKETEEKTQHHKSGWLQLHTLEADLSS